MKKLYSVILIFFVFIAFSNDAISQTKYPPIHEKPDTFKVTKTINLEYKYVPSIKEQIQNGTFIPADPSLTPFDHAIYDLQLVNCQV